MLLCSGDRFDRVTSQALDERGQCNVLSIRAERAAAAAVAAAAPSARLPSVETAETEPSVGAETPRIALAGGGHGKALTSARRERGHVRALKRADRLRDARERRAVGCVVVHVRFAERHPEPSTSREAPCEDKWRPPGLVWGVAAEKPSEETATKSRAGTGGSRRLDESDRVHRRRRRAEHLVAVERGQRLRRRLEGFRRLLARGEVYSEPSVACGSPCVKPPRVTVANR